MHNDTPSPFTFGGTKAKRADHDQRLSTLTQNLEALLDDAANLDLPLHKMFDRHNLEWRRSS